MILGVIMLVTGAIATVITGINAIQETETFSILGLDIVISQGDYTSLIISALVLILGAILVATSKGK